LRARVRFKARIAVADINALRMNGLGGHVCSAIAESMETSRCWQIDAHSYIVCLLRMAVTVIDRLLLWASLCAGQLVYALRTSLVDVLMHLTSAVMWM